MTKLLARGWWPVDVVLPTHPINALNDDNYFRVVVINTLRYFRVQLFDSFIFIFFYEYFL